MVLMVAGAVCFAVSSVWHVGLAIWWTLEASRRTAGVSSTGDRVPPGDCAAAPTVLWLVLINPTLTALAAAQAVGLRLPWRVRVVAVVFDPSQHEGPAQAGPRRADAHGADADGADAHGAGAQRVDTHFVVVPPRLDRAEMLNRAYHLIRGRCRDDHEDPARTVVGVIDADTVLDGSSAVAVWRAFGEPRVGAVQARVQIEDTGRSGPAEFYEWGVLADAVNLMWSRWDRARLGATGAFVRLSELSRLGRRPWWPGTTDDHELGLHLRRLGVVIRYRRDIQIIKSTENEPGIVRRSVRAAQSWLSVWPSPGSRRRERAWLALRLTGWLLPGLIVLWAAGAFAAAAWRLRAVPGSAAEAPALMGMAPGLNAPSGLALLQATPLWIGAMLVPVAVWRIARSDLAVGPLVRGVLGRPLRLMLRPVAFGLAVGRSLRRQPIRATGGWPRLLTLNKPREKPVFVDVTGRRNRRVWTVACGSAVAGLAYVVVVGIAVATGQIAPYAADRPHIDYPKPTPNPPTTPPAVPVEEPAESGADRPVGWIDTARPVPAAAVPPPRSTEPRGLADSSATPEPSPASELSPAPESSPAPSPAETDDISPEPGSSPSPSPSGSPGPSESSSPSPSESASPSPSADSSPSPTSSASPSPSPSPEPGETFPSSSPSPSPGATPRQPAA